MIAQSAQPSTKSEKKFLLTNSFWLLLGRGGSQVLALSLAIIVARSLGDVGLGQFTLVLTLLFIGNVFSTFGLDTLLIRSVAREPEKAPITAALIIQLTLSILFIVGVWLFAPTDTAGTGMRIYTFALLPLVITTASNAVLRAQERMSLYTTLQLLAAGYRLATAVLILAFGGGFLAIVWGLLVCQIIEAIAAGWAAGFDPASWLNSFRDDERSITNRLPSTHSVQQTFMAGLALAALTLFAILYQKVAIILLAYFGDAAMTGQFSAAMRLADVPRMVPYALAGALFPVMARGGEQAPSGRWFALLAIAFAGLALITHPTAAWIISLVFGNGYESAADILPILTWSLVPFVGVLYGSFVLVARNLESRVMLAHLSALLLAIALGTFGISRWGLLGLTGALVLTECAHAIILLTLSQRSLYATS